MEEIKIKVKIEKPLLQLNEQVFSIFKGDKGDKGDTGVVAIEETGSGNAYTASSYSEETKKITFTKGSTFLTSHQDISGKMDKANPTGTGSFSLNRKASSTIGDYSFAEGYNNTASSSCSHAEGENTIASGNRAHAEGRNTYAWGSCSHAEGDTTTANGQNSHVEGVWTNASRKSQHVFGEYNIIDNVGQDSSSRGQFVEIVGNGTGIDNLSNARTLDWSGNEVLAGTSTATGFKTPSGTSSQFLKADGTTDNNTYVTASQISNPNLLINGDFTVNQRGSTTYTMSGVSQYIRKYTVDRWAFTPQVNSSSSTVTVNSNSISVYCANQYDGFSQRFTENLTFYQGKTFTVSAKIKSVSGGTFALNINTDGTQRGYKNFTSAGIYSFNVTLPDTISNRIQVGIANVSNSANTVEIEYIKLEIGEVATPFSPRPYAEELAMCQRYYQVFTTSLSYGEFAMGVIDTTTSAKIYFPMTEKIRTNPTLLINDLSKFSINESGYYITPSGYSLRTIGSTNFVIDFTIPTHSQLAVPVELKALSSGGIISLDAEIY